MVIMLGFELGYNHQEDSFPFLIVRMPHIKSNVSQNIFYSAIKGEFLRIARPTLCLRDFIPNEVPQVLL